MSIRNLVRKAFVIDADITLKKVSEIMIARNIGCIVFLKGKKIKGIITKEDVVRNFGRDESVSNVMTKKVITVSVEESVDDVIKLMKKNRISFLPVVDARNNFIGIVGMKDLVSGMGEGEFLFS